MVEQQKDILIGDVLFIMDFVFDDQTSICLVIYLVFKHGRSLLKGL